MKFPLSWLREIIPISLEKEKIAEMLNLIGIEVEAVVPTPGGDWIFEVAITPNLSFAANMVGMAHQLHAMTGAKVHLPEVVLKESASSQIEEFIQVAVEENAGCLRYATRLAFDVQVGPSPSWIVERLEASGIRSVFNLVDITNYVMLEMGQPLHAFDYDKIQKHKISVRAACHEEKIITLDGKEHFLIPSDLVIADAQGPIALAGIMGAAHSEVKENTKRVLLEAAVFDSARIRKTSRRLGIHTEAARRFERQVDPVGVIKALDRAAFLIEKYCKATLVQGVLDVCLAPFIPREIACRVKRVNALLGTHLALNEMESIFRRLDLKIKNSSLEEMVVIIPSYRHDLHQEVDLIEEIARLYGLDNIHKDAKKVHYQGSTIASNPLYLLEKKIRLPLLSAGLQEFLTCDLISPEESALMVPIFPSRSLVKILNPTSTEHSVLRPSLLPNMLQVVKENVYNEIHDVAGFEIGRVHFKVKENYREPTSLAIVLTGKKEPLHWEKKPKFYDFFDLKGILENFFAAIHLEKVRFVASSFAHFHPGRQAALVVEQKEIGVVGEIHPNTLRESGLEAPVFFSEMLLEDLASHMIQAIVMHPLPHFPSSTRDWTVTVKQEFPMQTLLDWIAEASSDILEATVVLDLYRSEQLGSEVKNVTLRFTYRDPHATVSFERVEREHEKIVHRVTEKLNSI